MPTKWTRAKISQDIEFDKVNDDTVKLSAM